MYRNTMFPFVRRSIMGQDVILAHDETCAFSVGDLRVRPIVTKWNQQHG